jgi:hypothetical protein
MGENYVSGPFRSSVVRSVSVNYKGPTQVVGPSAKRVTLVLTTGDDVAVTLSTEPTVRAGYGLTLRAGYVLELTFEKHGDAIRGPWYGVTEAPNAAQVGFLDVSE